MLNNHTFKVATAAAMCMLLACTGCGSSAVKNQTENNDNIAETTVLTEVATESVELNRYQAEFMGVFDTATTVVGYAENEDIFREYVQMMHDELEIYHQLYDIYNDYEGVTGIREINRQAGVAPVEVDERILDLLEEAKEMYAVTGGKMNVAMGSVLSIWHVYREQGIDDPYHSELPDMAELEAAALHTSIDDVELDREAGTAFLKDPDMRLDVGSIAKGFAVEQVCRSLEAEGADHMLVSVGGNIRAIGAKPDGAHWAVGVQNPDIYSEQTYLHKVAITEGSLVTSGVYQRYYTVDGIQYHHIIDPDTLMPKREFKSVTILSADSGIADCLSTAVFNMTLDEGLALVEGMEEVDAMWVCEDDFEIFSTGFEARMLAD